MRATRAWWVCLSIALEGCSSNDDASPVTCATSCDGGDAASDVADATTSTDSSSAEADAPRADVASGDVETGGACTFNRECAAADRCECLDFDCRCRPGARGTGRNGIDTCTTGEDCASSLCAEGSDGKSYCSDECTSDTGCGPALPRCIDVAGIGKICARKP